LKVGLFIPCYIDQFYPEVAVATLELLEKLGCEVAYPLNQTCCGQPMANSGFAVLAEGCDHHFIKNFSGFDYVVCPSGSCVLHIKEHLQTVQHEQSALKIRSSVFELSEFLTDILQIKNVNARFPYRVGFHTSCHGQRGLHLSSMSELVAPDFSKPMQLLQMVEGITLLQTKRMDDCCGFGGTFCVTEEAVSVKMGEDRIEEHLNNQVEYITGVDTSCLMHLEGILKRKNSNVKTIHIAQILNAGLSL
jgi:L-lactate dehydrogenase complex protein LldE